MKIFCPQRPADMRDGIKRVLEAQRKYLPQFDVEFVESGEEADLTIGHGTTVTGFYEKPFVSHNHGLYWNEYQWGNQEYATNRHLLVALQQADAITVPSHWVARAMARGMYANPQVVYHGVDTAEFTPAESQGYILYNKARHDAISDEAAMQQLAALLPDQQFVTTVGQPTANVRVIGVQTPEQMREWVRNAGLYLATTRETFGIGTLEALACGVPIVGWKYGGQEEIVRHGDTGFLASLNDYQTLSEYVRHAASVRFLLSSNARQDALTRWQWQDKIEQYARLYHGLVAHKARPKVGIVIPCYNLARYLPAALKSVLQQTFTDWECLIVDDASSDDVQAIVREHWDSRFHFVRNPENRGLSAVRNLGAQQLDSDYLLYLDADDMLTPNALQLLVDALDHNPLLHIAYGKLDVINEDGSNRRPNSFPNEFNWYRQLSHLNCVPTGAMVRRKVVQWSGGWRTRQWRAEDAEFWSRVTSFGSHAELVTSETTLLYRLRPDSKGIQERQTYPDNDGNWLAHLPWRNANTAQEGQDYYKQFGNTVRQPDLVPFGAQGAPPKSNLWAIPHYQEPKVACIVLCTDGTTDDELIDTLDSLMGQTVKEWQAVIVGKTAPAGFAYAHVASTREDADALLRTKTYFTVDAGVLLSTRAIADLLHVPEVAPRSNQVQLRFRGQQRAPIGTVVNGRRYLSSKGQTIFVPPEDVDALVRIGRYEKIGSAALTETRADERKVIEHA